MKKFIYICAFILFSIFIFKIYLDRIGTFSFVDEYDNFVAAFFMLKNKILFKDIYHNRQLGMVYLSYVIQLITNPQTLYKLVLYHRLFIMVFSFLAGLLLVIRFNLLGLTFIFIFEIIKYYFHGNLFIAESLILYPLVYLSFLSIDRINNKKILISDYIFSGIFTWFVVFMREPYIPLVLILYFVILFGKKELRLKIISFFVFSTLSLITIFTTSVKDYLFQVILVNQSAVLKNQITENEGLIKMIFKAFSYPIYILFAGKINHYHLILIGLSILFIILIFYHFFIKKRRKEALFILLILGMAAIRATNPGEAFYGAYRMLVWVGLFISSILILIKDIKNKRSFKISVLFLFLIFMFSIFSPQSYLWEKINKEKVFDINYNHYYVYGETIKKLVRPQDKLFIDGYDSLVFYQSGINSAYKYSLFYPAMKNISLFTNERLKMFKNSPPAFYYRDCVTKNDLKLPDFVVSKYINFKTRGNPSCLYIRKDILVDPIKLEEISKFGFSF